MKYLLMLAVIIASTSAFAYQTCTSSEGQQVTANVEKDAGHIEAVVISYNSRSFNFYPQGKYFVLDKNASQSPGFSTIRISSRGFNARQVSDTGTSRWITFACQ